VILATAIKKTKLIVSRKKQVAFCEFGSLIDTNILTTRQTFPLSFDIVLEFSHNGLGMANLAAFQVK